ncbi:hypothetical protein IT568_07990, partial [bacterium]|nr:hypothetical protein [bacterium]
MNFKLSLLASLSLATTVFGFDYKPNTKPFEVRIPQETYLNLKNTTKQAKLSQLPLWQKFRKQNGNFSVAWNEFRGNPHRVTGEPIQILGFSRIDKNNAEQAAKAFLSQNSALLKLKINELELENLSEQAGIFYADFYQTFNQTKIFDSRITLRMTSDAKVILFGSDAFPEAEPSNSLALDLSTAVSFAKNSINFNENTDENLTQNKTWLLPLV